MRLGICGQELRYSMYALHMLYGHGVQTPRVRARRAESAIQLYEFAGTRLVLSCEEQSQVALRHLNYYFLDQAVPSSRPWGIVAGLDVNVRMLRDSVTIAGPSHLQHVARRVRQARAALPPTRANASTGCPAVRATRGVCIRRKLLLPSGQGDALACTFPEPTR
jgi:hypothetical protein